MSQKVDVSYVVTYNQDKANPHLVVNFPRPDSNPYYLPDHKVTVECWGSKDKDEPTSTTTFKKVKLNFVISYNTPTLV
ncbi:MAG: hypothetical protein LBF36_01830 [Mycoplasmataceae bacterium]|jgi:hypothetical protein|nr:hypothetical protein [Mycoplasmataceae bacterium]